MSEILRSWKEIARYTGASVRTLQRWEKDFHLRIRRIASKKGSVVFAFRSDLDSWFRARTQTAEITLPDDHFRMMFMNSPLPTIVLDNERKILEVPPRKPHNSAHNPKVGSSNPPPATKPRRCIP